MSQVSGNTLFANNDGYTSFAKHQYATTVGLSSVLSVLYPSIKDAYIEGFFGPVCPYRDPEIRIRNSEGLLRLFKVHADDAENWRQRFFAEVGECFGLQRFRIHTNDGELTINKNTPIDDLIGRERQVFYLDAEGNEEDQVSAIPSPRFSGLSTNDTQEQEQGKEMKIGDRLTTTADDGIDENDLHYNEKVRDFLFMVVFDLLTNPEFDKEFKSDGFATTVEAFKTMEFNDGTTMRDAIHSHGGLNSVYFVQRAYNVLRKARSKAGHLWNDNENAHYIQDNGDYISTITGTAVDEYVRALQLFPVDAKVSHSYEPALVLDDQFVELPEETEDHIVSKMGETLSRFTSKVDRAAHNAKTHLKTATSAVHNFLHESKYVRFSVVGAGTVKAAKRVTVEPGQTIGIEVFATNSQGPKEVMLRVEERGSPDGKGRYCATYLLKRWKNLTYNIAFTIPLRKGKYNIIVYEPHKGGAKNVWQKEGGASFNCASVGTKSGFKITWNEVAQMKSSNDTIKNLIFLTPEITYGRIAGQWPRVVVSNNGKTVETTYSDRIDLNDEIEEWTRQRSEQKIQEDAIAFYASIEEQAKNKAKRILRCLYCMNIYLRNANVTTINPGKYNASGIDDDASPEDYGNTPDVIASTITLFGTSYDSSLLAAQPFSSVRAVTEDPVSLGSDNLYEGVNKEKLTNILADSKSQFSPQPSRSSSPLLSSFDATTQTHPTVVTNARVPIFSSSPPRVLSESSPLNTDSTSQTVVESEGFDQNDTPATAELPQPPATEETESLPSEPEAATQTESDAVEARRKPKRHNKRRAHILASIQTFEPEAPIAARSRPDISDNDDSVEEKKEKKEKFRFAKAEALISHVLFSKIVRRDAIYVIVMADDDRISQRADNFQDYIERRIAVNGSDRAITRDAVFNASVNGKACKLQITDDVNVITDVGKGRILDASGQRIIADNVVFKVYGSPIHDRRIALVVYTNALE